MSSVESESSETSILTFIHHPCLNQQLELGLPERPRASAGEASARAALLFAPQQLRGWGLELME